MALIVGYPSPPQNPKKQPKIVISATGGNDSSRNAGIQVGRAVNELCFRQRTQTKHFIPSMQI
jgi:hypothetical protein